MKPKPFGWLNLTPYALAVVAVAFAGAVTPVLADQIQMQNGDHYVGKVLSVNKDTLLLQSEILGTVRLPRDRMAWIAFGTNPPVVLPSAPGSNVLGRAEVTTNAVPQLTGPLRQLGSHTNLIRQIQTQYLNDSPEASAKFNEMLGGLMSGKLNIQDIRAQAQAAAAQVRSMRKDMDQDTGGLLDTYLAILDKFVSETAPASSAATNPPAARR